ncbi:MAG: LacI family DNA-binding transcriptional regulator [Armatimonadota bacterium]
MSTESPATIPARLEDIARAVGVSRSEVSRVLNNRVREGRGVGKAKMEEIRRVASELGYQPNRAARTLARGRTDMVGLPIRVAPDRELAPHYHEIVGALTRTFGALGLHLTLIDWDADPLSPLERIARARAVDGILLTDITVDDARPALLESLGMPYVVRGTTPHPGAAAVGADNVAVGRMAVEHLVAHGHRRILFHNVGRALMAGEGRHTGFQSATHAAGITSTVRYVDDIYLEGDVHAFALQVLSKPDRPTAIHAADEIGAFAFQRAAYELGLRIPEDLSLSTCLNARMMRRLLPGIDAINIRQDEVATEAGMLLAAVVRGGAPDAGQRLIAPRVEPCGSVAPPRAG